MRKVICLICLFLVFAVQSSFLYEIVDIQYLIVGSASVAQASSDVEPADEAEADDADDALLPDEDETYTLEDVLSAQQNINGDHQHSSVSENSSLMQAGEDVLESLHKSDWNLILVNKQHPIPEDYSFTLGTIKGSMKCDERILDQLTQMMQAARQDGVTLVIRSPYRNDSRQDYLFNRKLKNYMKKKMSYLEAFRASAQAVTIPGSSEHQIGLALDIVSDTYTLLEEGFADTDAGRWLAQNSYKYGFILRYPKGKEDITGIEFEPWHFRYVDEPSATYIYQHNLTLEEFVQLLGE